MHDDLAGHDDTPSQPTPPHAVTTVTSCGFVMLYVLTGGLWGDSWLCVAVQSAAHTVECIAVFVMCVGRVGGVHGIA